MGQSLANGPSQEGHKPAPLREGNAYYPQLRPGYIPIPIIHEGLENRQQHPCYVLQQPGMQRVRSEPVPSHKRAQSPLRSYTRPQSPGRGRPESPPLDRQGGQVGGSPAPSGSPQGPSPPPSTTDSQSNLSQSPGRQSPGRQSVGGHQLPRGYIPIRVIHENNVPRQPTHSFQFAPKTHYSQPPGEYQPHQPVFCKVQDERDSRAAPAQPASKAAPRVLSSRENSPVRIVTPAPSGEKPQVQQIPVQRESPPRNHQDNQPSSPVSAELPTYAPIQMTFTEAECKPPPRRAVPEKVEMKIESPIQTPPAEEAPPPYESVPQKEPEAAESQQKHPGVLQVERILEKVEALEKAVEDFKGRRSEKRYLVLEEDLTKALLALDSVDPEGRVDVRQVRRDGVRKVQNILEALEQKASEGTEGGQAMDLAGSSQDSMEVENTADRSNVAPGSSDRDISRPKEERAPDPSSSAPDGH
ncbi:BAG family molecular chaperone regulator 3 isoform X2 [Spea bombifrons]|nr:BAG family molecular chaperone regulator 3 isoform X2 [Spea bombifrons]